MLWIFFPTIILIAIVLGSYFPFFFPTPFSFFLLTANYLNGRLLLSLHSGKAQLLERTAPNPAPAEREYCFQRALRWWAPVKWLVKKSNVTLRHRPEIGDKVAAWRCAEPALSTVVLQVDVPFPSWFWKQKVWRSLRLFGANFDSGHMAQCKSWVTHLKKIRL